MVERRWGYIADLYDPRDFDAQPMLCARMEKAPLPEKVDLRAKMPPIEDQGRVGDCIFNALAGIMEYLQIMAGEPLVNMSRLYPYWYARKLRGWENSDNGALIRDGIKVLAKRGTCHETTWPHDESKVCVRPSSVADIEAEKHQAIVYRSISTNAENLKASLAMGYPVVFGMNLAQSFMGEMVGKTGVVPLPQRNESRVGGHAMLVVGYDAKNWIVRNSWGMWGDGGYCYMPLAMFREFADLWLIEKVESGQ